MKLQSGGVVFFPSQAGIFLPPCCAVGSSWRRFSCMSEGCSLVPPGPELTEGLAAPSPPWGFNLSSITKDFIGPVMAFRVGGSDLIPFKDPFSLSDGKYGAAPAKGGSSS